MIIVGDIASPTDYTTSQLEKVFKEYKNIFKGKNVIINLEGLLSNKIISDKNPDLWNCERLPLALKGILNPIFCLANNHTLDFPDKFDQTILTLQKENILYVGAARTIYDARKPIIFYEGEQQVVLFNACWRFLLYHNRNPSSGIHLSQLEENRLLNQVAEYKRECQNVKIVIYLHWSLDLETLPFPMYRGFSRDLIDAGSDIVIGSHSHCVQGGEKYKEGYIIYGLGNFFLPNNLFINSKLEYPEFASFEIAFEWNPMNNEATCHWFKYNKQESEHKLHHISSEKFDQSVILTKFSPFQGMNENEYISYFKKNRRKKLLIPVFKTYKKRRLNEFLTLLLISRARFARFLAIIGLREWAK